MTWEDQDPYLEEEEEPFHVHFGQIYRNCVGPEHLARLRAPRIIRGGPAKERGPDGLMHVFDCAVFAVLPGPCDSRCNPAETGGSSNGR